MTTFYTARDYTDQFANLNFIINMKSLKEKEKEKKDRAEAGPRLEPRAEPRTEPRTVEPVAGPSSAAD